MDPRTGAILAMANWPLVNGNDPPAKPEEAFENRAVTFNYEPGSTFKVVAVSGALQEGRITPNSGFEIPDQIELGGRTIHDDTEHETESLTASQILAQSSNVGAIKIAGLLGPEKFNSWVHSFGFGAPTGANIPGEEIGATLPLDKYSGSSMGNLPIGQGELVTPIQMATLYSAIANGVSCARHTSSVRSGVARSRSRQGGELYRRALRLRFAKCLRACFVGGHGERGIDTRLPSRRQDRNGQQDRP